MVKESNSIIKQWLNDLAFSAATWNLEAHMDLVSEKVQVLGVPNRKKIDYHGWKKRRHNEFNKKLLRSLTYRDAKLLNEGPESISFSVLETMKDHSMKSIEVKKEITLHQELDGKWRVVREQIINIKVRAAGR